MKAQKLKDVIAVLRAHGWVFLRDAGGSHEVWGTPDGTARMTIPRHREVSPGVLRQIARQLGAVPPQWR